MFTFASKSTVVLYAALCHMVNKVSLS
uniref:Uncharacterized protein n=1 Tax=Anguilla anguilla TaxID=7936 RepID=A0A0E9QD40_ANGAN